MNDLHSATPHALNATPGRSGEARSGEASGSPDVRTDDAIELQLRRTPPPARPSREDADTRPMLLSEGDINTEKAPAPAPLLLKLGTVLTLLFAPLLTGLVYAAYA